MPEPIPLNVDQLAFSCPLPSHENDLGTPSSTQFLLFETNGLKKLCANSSGELLSSGINLYPRHLYTGVKGELSFPKFTRE